MDICISGHHYIVPYIDIAWHNRVSTNAATISYFYIKASAKIHFSINSNALAYSLKDTAHAENPKRVAPKTYYRFLGVRKIETYCIVQEQKEILSKYHYALLIV